MCSINLWPHYPFIEPLTLTKKGQLVLGEYSWKKELVFYNMKVNSSKTLMAFEERMEWRTSTYADSSITLNCDCWCNRESTASIMHFEGE
jgi:hypothetical protein